MNFINSNRGRTFRPVRSREVGVEIKWEDGFMIRVSTDVRTAVISANREGLLSLAEQLAALAEEEPGSHIHYDMNNSLEDGSDELIIEKV